MGCLAAIPAGPVQIEVVRRSINGHLKSSLMVVLGAFLADVSYGAIAFFGIAPYLEKEKVMALFWLAGGLVLIVLGLMSIRHSLNKGEIVYAPRHLKKKRWAFRPYYPDPYDLGGFQVRIFKDLG
jgi:threonine/homoserine/homoserine lactone efflux protein